MSSLYTTRHTVDWDKGKTYFVRCEDEFNIENQGCAIQVNPA